MHWQYSDLVVALAKFINKVVYARTLCWKEALSGRRLSKIFL